MSRSQRDKGANAEREVVTILREYGIDARRGQVFNHEPDIVTNTKLHIEVKRQETLRINDWWKQSESASDEDEIPTVIFRRSREDWKIMLSLADFLSLVKLGFSIEKEEKKE